MGPRYNSPLVAPLQLFAEDCLGVAQEFLESCSGVAEKLLGVIR